LPNPQGNSRLCFEDYAVALVDELEKRLIILRFLDGVQPGARSDFSKREVDLSDAEPGVAASGGVEQVIFIEKKLTTNEQPGHKYDFTTSAYRQSEVRPETTQRFPLLFSPQLETVARVASEVKTQLLDRLPQF
jgi:hypothetical protein